MSGKPDYVGATNMRLDQDHLHPELEVLRPTCLGREMNLGHRGGRRALEQRINSYAPEAHIM